MVKSVLGVNHQGYTDWVIQRLSAIYMAIFTFSLFSFVLWHPDISFTDWTLVFGHVWVKVASLLFVFLMLYHTWIGIWTVGTDYIKPFIIRAIFNVFVLLMLSACFIWGVMILWSV